MRGLKAKRIRNSINYKTLKDQDPIRARKYYRKIKKLLDGKE